LFFGSNLFPHWSALPLKRGLEPGEYNCTLTIEDRLAGQLAKWVQQVRVRPPELALVSVGFAYDAKGAVIAPAGGHAGQVLYTSWTILGLKPGLGKVDGALEIQLRDSAGNLKTKPGKTAIIKDNPLPEAPDAAIDFVLPLSRPGSFVLSVAVTDRVAKKSTQFEMTFHVSEP
jgi:hypothetical protein